MRVLIFCLCLLDYVSFSLTQRPTLPSHVHEDNIADLLQQKQWFNFGYRGSLPDEAKDVMLPTTTSPPVTTKPARLPMVEALCHIDRMYVRILKNAVNDTRAWRHLYFGNCRVNNARGPYYYFLYPLTRCGLKPQVLNDSIVFKNVVRYLPVYVPVNPSSNITRTRTLTVPVTCRYPRFHRAYDAGIHPLFARNYTMSLPVAGYIYIVVLDANWAPLDHEAYFRLGEAIHFEIRVGAGQRAFADRCWIAASGNPAITRLVYTPIKNYGCMVDSMNSSLSKYHSNPDHALLRFTVEAFYFPSMTGEQELVIFCEVTVAPMPSLSRKSCTYDRMSDTWYELDRVNDHLCDCCKVVCPDPPSHRSGPRATKISSAPFRAWGGQDKEAKSVPVGGDKDGVSVDQSHDFDWPGATTKISSAPFRAWGGQDKEAKSGPVGGDKDGFSVHQSHDFVWPGDDAAWTDAAFPNEGFVIGDEELW